MARRLALALVVSLLALPAGAAARVSSSALLLQFDDGRVATIGARGGAVHALGVGSTASWSPDGRSIALSRSGDIFALSADGRRSRRLTHDPLVEFAPEWSPDGSRIAFFRQHVEPLADDVVVEDSATGGTRQLTTDQTLKSELSWTSDGRQLVYLRSTVPLRSAVTVIDAMTGSQTQPVTYTPYPRWSSDGRGLAYVVQDGEQLELVVARRSGPARVLFRGAADIGLYDAAWSPNGRFLVFTYGGWGLSSSRLELADVVSGRVRALTPVRSHDSAPSWAPDSRHIAFARYEPSEKRYAVAVLARNGDGLHILHRSRHFAQPLWRPSAH